jgi:uncharacterized protein (TIGR02594 family)
MIPEPRWLEIARSDLGVGEIAGPKANPRIMAYYKAAGAGWAKDDAVPWCGAAMAAWISLAEYAPPPESARARAWLDWGVPLEMPKIGAVVVFQRGSDPSAGHVALYLEDRGDRILCLGGNQGDAVSITAFPKRDVLGYRWPQGAEVLPDPPKVVVVPDKPLTKSRTVRHTVGGLWAAAAGFADQTLSTALEWAATVTTYAPVQAAAVQMGGNVRSIALGIGTFCGVKVLSARAEAKLKGEAA